MSPPATMSSAKPDDPPQSISPSVPLRRPSKHVACSQTPRLQMPLKQSPATRQVRPNAHASQSGPPQSTAVSARILFVIACGGQCAVRFAAIVREAIAIVAGFITRTDTISTGGSCTIRVASHRRQRGCRHHRFHPAVRMPLPQAVIVQSRSQPSPSARLPSSQASPSCTTPFSACRFRAIGVTPITVD